MNAGAGELLEQDVPETIPEIARRRVAELADREVPLAPETPAWCVWAPEHRAWWAPGRYGYTEDATSAGVYTRAEAVQIWIDSRYQDVPVPAAAARELMAALDRYAQGLGA